MKSLTIIAALSGVVGGAVADDAHFNEFVMLPGHDIKNDYNSPLPHE